MTTLPLKSKGCIVGTIFVDILIILLVRFRYKIINFTAEIFCNHFHNILRLFDVLSNLPFTTSEMMRGYYLKTWYIRVALLTVVKFLLQLNFVLDITLHWTRVTPPQSFYLISHEITDSLNNSTCELMSPLPKTLRQLTDLIARFIASILAFL